MRCWCTCRYVQKIAANYVNYVKISFMYGMYPSCTSIKVIHRILLYYLCSPLFFFSFFDIFTFSLPTSCWFLPLDLCLKKLSSVLGSSMSMPPMYQCITWPVRPKPVILMRPTRLYLGLSVLCVSAEAPFVAPPSPILCSQENSWKQPLAILYCSPAELPDLYMP